MNKSKLIKLAIIAAIMVVIWNIPAPAGLEVDTWHLVSLYLGLLVGLILKPLPEPVITLIIVGLTAMFVDTSVLLNGYGNSMPWFLCAVTIVCTAFVKTGLGKRIAYILLTKCGNSTLSLGYILVLTDLVLSPATGSNTSRTSIIWPIFNNLSEGAGSTAENQPRKLGAYLSVLMYTSSQGTSALFLTGMATNAITVSLISEMLGINITWGTWFLAAIVPMGLFLFLAPLAIYKIYPPQLKRLDEVKPLAVKGLEELGPVTLAEKKLFVLFILAVLGWMFGTKISFLTLNMQVVGFVFLALTLLVDILDWNDVMAAKGAWNVFIWYGGFFGVATSLSNAGFYTWLADFLGDKLKLGSINGLVVTIVLLLCSLVIRYFFVSSSAFVASFYPVLLSLALGTQANPMTVALLLCFFAGIGALLTHYGNGAGLVTFASGYVPQKDFWLVGTCMVVMALVLFLVIGLPYWSLIGLI